MPQAWKALTWRGGEVVGGLSSSLAGGWRHWCNQSCVGEREKVEEKKLRKIGIGGRKWFFCRL